jgi:hypothetical protein
VNSANIRLRNVIVRIKIRALWQTLLRAHAENILGGTGLLRLKSR